MPLGTEVGIGPGDTVRWGPSYPSSIGVQPPFSANVRCGQMAGWTKMPLGMEVCLSPGDFVFGGVAAPLKGAQPPVLGPCLSWPNGRMDEDATWYGSRPRSRPHCVKRGPSSQRERGTAAPLFSAHVYCGHGHPSQLLLNSFYYR